MALSEIEKIQLTQDLKLVKKGEPIDIYGKASTIKKYVKNMGFKVKLFELSEDHYKVAKAV